MSVYTSVVSGLLFPIHERVKGHNTVALRRDLEKSQWLDRGALEALRLQRLKRFLDHVNRHVPYYRQLFREIGFVPEQVRSIADLQKIPFADKATMRKHTDRLKSEACSDLKRFNTGGSSGEPLIFFIGRERVSHDVAAKWRATRWWGVDIGDRELVIWGSPIELGAQDRVRLLRDAVLRTRLLSAFDMSREKLDGYLEIIRDFKPGMLFGYPSALSHIAGHAREKGIDMTDLGIKVAFVTSERLYDHQRRQIGATFGCPVANGYGGRDAGFIAHECPEGNMHISAEDIIVEIVDKEHNVLNPGEEGEIVITHLATGDYPFIRYKTGDIGAISDDVCACGRTLPLLSKLEGRATDFVVARDGSVLHGLALIYILRDITGIAEFKIIQESLDQVRLEIVRGDGYTPDCETAVIDAFRRRLGSAVQVRFDYVDAIQPEKSGKYRYVVSHVDTEATPLTGVGDTCL